MTTKSSGFTLIELMVVVAIIGILAAAGTLTYSGYVKGAKRGSAENIIQQVALAQTEEYSNTGTYYITGSSDACDADLESTRLIEENLFGGEAIIGRNDDKVTPKIGFEKNTKVIIKDVSKSVLKVIMMAKLEQILNLE